jgi:DNA-directed RNA polymerase specialized sigma24 family protein
MPDPVEEILSEAMDRLPASKRDELLGEGYVALQTMEGVPREQQVSRLERHLWRHLRRCQRMAGLAEDVSAPAADDVLAMQEELDRLSPLDQAIVAMIIGGSTQNEVARAVQCSPATITRRLKRLRGQG